MTCKASKGGSCSEPKGWVGLWWVLWGLVGRCGWGGVCSLFDRVKLVL